MLAYVFWHWPQPSTVPAQYKSDLIQFHQVLQEKKPEGFQRSIVFLIHGASWLRTNGLAYEEWYLLDDSAAMDRINYAAVHGPCEEPHNRVARNAADGTGGLYRLRVGHENFESTTLASWFSKPSGVSYQAFDEQLGKVVLENNGTVWGRQMTLGPTTEFCLHSSAEVQLPAELGATLLPLEKIWIGRSL